MTTRKVQCEACPWKKSTNPHEDIPNYNPEKHEGLVSCQSQGLLGGCIQMMACHESKPGNEYPCVGWVVNQLGPGNNIGLRLRAIQGEFGDLETVGEQYETMAEMLATARTKKPKKKRKTKAALRREMFGARPQAIDIETHPMNLKGRNET